MNTIQQQLDRQQRSVNLTFVSSFIPRKCGVATFTKDLTKAINDLNPHRLARIVAMHDPFEPVEYPREVVRTIERNERASYREAAAMLNDSEAEVVCLQHEFGLYGGDAGSYILELIKHLRKPIVTTLHTILEQPSETQRSIIREIADRSAITVGMIPKTRERLEETYGIPPNRIVVIHHGVADRPRATRQGKTALGWQNRQVLLMTGLLGPDKGVEYVLQAIPDIRMSIPNILFVVAGETHPSLVKNQGEQYRHSLEELVRKLGIADSVSFINRYLPLDELLRLYEACDIYLTPHLNPQQVTSGTLAYALGMGKACVSTPYVYAREMLSDGRGMLVEFRDPAGIAAAVKQILSDPSLLEGLEERAYAIGRMMSWPLVAERYLNLFRVIQGAGKEVAQHPHAQG